MKINPVSPLHQAYRNQLEPLRQGKSARKEKDELQISQAAMQMQASTKMEWERAEKVERIKAEIDNGTYTVDPHAVARKFYEFWTFEK